MPALRPVLACVAVLAGLCLPPALPAQVRRCVLPDGTPLFTDRRCAELGARDTPVASARARAAGAVRQVPHGCARNLQDLVYALTTAVDARDVNRLASLHHWTGISDDAAGPLLARLETVARRPLVDVVPVYAPAGAETGEPADTAAAPAGAASSRRGAPVALRLEQTLADGRTPARTVFALRRRYGCWWLSL
ncbi:hypothetical protein [Vulcaniibacterium gelatinicum]|uniref:hypothetical protein n=1 Tax=Vulcaniibacterium gelatinicum TaxID=2598725 RepID=UPI0011CB9599|nr:hypothetical protein [Vulcaniibacterium gelatinicum]